MNSGSKVIKLSEFPAIGSREAGVSVRVTLKSSLHDFHSIEIDFENRAITPSFADECFGVLAEEIGMREFGSRIKPVNLPSKSRVLIGHVVRQRAPLGAPETVR